MYKFIIYYTRKPNIDRRKNNFTAIIENQHFGLKGKNF